MVKEKGYNPEDYSKGFAAPILILIILIIVGVAGGAYFLGSKNTKTSVPVQNVATSKPQITPIPTVDETANWKTYTNSKYDYSIRYPTEWILKENSTNLFSTTISSLSGDALIDIFIIESSWEQAKSKLESESTKTNLGQIPVLLKSDKRGAVKMYSFNSNRANQYFQINYLRAKDTSAEEVDILDQILSTFKFTN